MVFRGKLPHLLAVLSGPLLTPHQLHRVKIYDALRLLSITVRSSGFEHDYFIGGLVFYLVHLLPAFNRSQVPQILWSRLALRIRESPRIVGTSSCQSRCQCSWNSEHRTAVVLVVQGGQTAKAKKVRAEKPWTQIWIQS